MKELYQSDSLSAQLYDVSAPRDDVDCYIQQARRTGGPVLELCGLKVLACYGDFKGGRPRCGKEQIWVAAR
jgi:hypothetical protein